MSGNRVSDKFDEKTKNPVPESSSIMEVAASNNVLLYIQDITLKGRSRMRQALGSTVESRSTSRSPCSPRNQRTDCDIRAIRRGFKPQ